MPIWRKPPYDGGHPAPFEEGNHPARVGPAGDHVSFPGHGTMPLALTAATRRAGGEIGGDTQRQTQISGSCMATHALACDVVLAHALRKLFNGTHGSYSQVGVCLLVAEAFAYKISGRMAHSQHILLLALRQSNLVA